MRGARFVSAVAAAVACALAGCGGASDDGTRDDAAPGEAAPPAFAIPDPSEIPVPDLSDMEPRVQIILRDAAGRVRSHLSVASEWGRYGMILDAHEVYREATAAYRTAVRLAPGEFQWHYLLARVLELQGADQEKPGTVEAELEEARKLKGDYAPLYVRLGAVYARTDRPEEARAAYERAESLDPTSLPARIGTARALLAAGETDAALAKVERCAIEHPDDWEVQMLLARVYAVAGRREEARAAANRARELPQAAEYPDPVVGEMLNYAVSATACFKRARSLSAAGDFENAVMNLKVVVEVRPDYAPAHERLAWCCLQLGRYKAARRHYTRAIELAPDMEPAYRGLAQVLEAMELPAEAAAVRARADSVKTASS